MILDYNYNQQKSTLTISYINSDGNKKLITKNVRRFKTYKSDPRGEFKNWDGSRCTVAHTDRPHSFDLKTYFEELPISDKNKLYGKTSPRLYTFDIETEISDEFPEPSEAKFPITTISIASPECNVMVLGTKDLDEGGDKNLQTRLNKYLGDSEFFNGLGIKMPYIKYVKFSTERAMLEYFIKEFVAKVSILAGWNSILFDWQYIQNRIKGYYSDLDLSLCSSIGNLSYKNYTDMKNNKVTLSMPCHTLILDMMDVVGNFDQVVMPIKESLSLDYIASESIGMHKIKYDGDLQKLFETDYSTYVFYNAIDSILVQLIDKRFKTLQNIYAQALYCNERIGSCFSKIALSEALFFNYFYNNNIKIVPINVWDRERGTLVGAYVAQPTPGIHRWVTCNDFASLYPSIIRTTNISIENFVGTFYDEEALIPYKENRKDYVVVGGTVYKNSGTAVKPSLGEMVCVKLREKELDVYRKDPNYFVSSNGHVYHNDKDYSFKAIQTGLANDRNKSKYLAKQLDAIVVVDIDHLKKGLTIKSTNYPDNIVDALKNIGWDIKCTTDICALSGDQFLKFEKELKEEILYLGSFEQACKLLMNSLYGGSSHVAFAFFLLELANDITGEARTIIHLMEDHIPTWFEKNWYQETELHKLLGITVNKKVNEPLIKVVAGDTDSLYLCYSQLLNTIDGIDKMSNEQIRDIIVKLNLEFLDQHNEQFMNEYYESRHAKSVQKFELETIAMSECRLDVKKRYAQLLAWKDGKVYDMDDLPMKVKGLEMIKSSYPKQAREGLKRMVRYLLEDKGGGYLLQRVNMKLMQEKQAFFRADLEDICGNVGVQNYTKYILSDNDPSGLKIAAKCPYNVRALGNYNWIRNVHNLPGDPLYGGKMKWYCFYPNGVKTKKKQDPDYFAFQSRNYPTWADKYAPICREAMFERMMMEPFNRILDAVGVGKLNSDGSIQMGLF